MKIYFYPDRPKPGHKILRIMARRGLEHGTLEDHDLRMWYSFKTVDDTPLLPQTINGGCRDVSKSRVDAIFREVFGYSMHVDPAKERALEKSEEQAAYKMRIVEPPTQPKGGHVYRRVIDTRHLSVDGTMHVDLRLPIFGSEIPFVALKERRSLLSKKWQHVRFAPVSRYFDAHRVQKIKRFAAQFGADYADIDVLLEASGRMYIIDVNNGATDGMLARFERKHPKEGRKLGRKLAACFDTAFINERYLVR